MTISQPEHIRRAVTAHNARPVLVKLSDWVRDSPEGGIAAMFVIVQAVCIAAGFAFPDTFRYLLPANIAVTLKSIAPLGLMALGVGVLMVAGEFDLSVGALYSFLSIVAATLSNQLGGDQGAPNASMLAPFVGMAVALALGALIGCFHAAITLRFAIPSFITTLGGMLLWRGATLLYHGATSLRFRPTEPFITIFGGEWGVLSSMIIWFGVFSVLFYFLLHRHRLGNHFFAVGGNRNAAIAIGVNPVRTKVIAFAIAGFHGRARRGDRRDASGLDPARRGARNGVDLDRRLRHRRRCADWRPRLDPGHRPRRRARVHDPGHPPLAAGARLLLRHVRRRADRHCGHHEHRDSQLEDLSVASHDGLQHFGARDHVPVDQPIEGLEPAPRRSWRCMTSASATARSWRSTG